MKLGACVVFSDLNPLYLDFYPLVHRMWRDLVGVRAVLALIADHIPAQLRDLRDDIVLVPPVDGVHPGFQAQCVRLLMPQLLGGDADSAILIADVDILPTNAGYFLRPLESAPPNAVVVYRNGALPTDQRQVIICYNAATADTWRDLFEPVASVDEMRAVLKRWYKGRVYDGVPGGPGWFTDQEMMFERVAGMDQSRVVRFSDADLGFDRLCRDRIGDGFSDVQRRGLARQTYADYHMKRPHAQFRALNEQAVALVMKQKVAATGFFGRWKGALSRLGFAAVQSHGRAPRPSA